MNFWCPNPLALITGIFDENICLHQLLCAKIEKFMFFVDSFSTPGSGVGLFCSTPGVPLARSVPRKISAYMLLTGLPINAQEALRSGLISKLVKDEDELTKV